MSFKQQHADTTLTGFQKKKKTFYVCEGCVAQNLQMIKTHNNILYCKFLIAS